MPIPTTPQTLRRTVPPGFIRVRGRVAGGLRHAQLRSEARRVWLFTAFLAMIAALGYTNVVQGLTPIQSEIDLPWPLLAIGFLAALVLIRPLTSTPENRDRQLT